MGVFMALWALALVFWSAQLFIYPPNTPTWIISLIDNRNGTHDTEDFFYSVQMNFKYWVILWATKHKFILKMVFKHWCLSYYYSMLFVCTFIQNLSFINQIETKFSSMQGLTSGFVKKGLGDSRMWSYGPFDDCCFEKVTYCPNTDTSCSFGDKNKIKIQSYK